MRRLVRQLHAWIGLAMSLLLFVLALTGSALVYKEAYWRAVYPELRAPAPQLGPADHARAIAAADAAFGLNLNSVKLPEPGVSAYHLYLHDGEAFLSSVDHRIIDEWRPPERVMSFLFDLHAHLMAGDAGERVGGVISLLGVFLALTGTVLWWPARRTFSLRNLLPRGTSRHALRVWHRDLGIVSTPLLLVLLLSGSALVFYATAGRMLNAMFGDAPQLTTAPPADAGPPVALADSAMLALVEQAFPGARLVFYYPPRDGIGYNEFRIKQPCELHPNGRSYLYLNAAGEVLAKSDPCVMPVGERTLHASYPLHSGKTESGLYKFAVFLGGVILAVLSLSGAVTYVQKLLPGGGSRARGKQSGNPRMSAGV
ncbi:MAG TPA: PepSY-associated TM helix domain-containing protein [Longimicrobiales bacterium]|nr:PepSY-associated TM helix domain-containing protein [Longimicrobiales bacterium]